MPEICKTDDYPAFPCSALMTRGAESFPHPFPGLTKREWFAGMALQGLVSNSKGFQFGAVAAANAAVGYADALLALLDK